MTAFLVVAAALMGAALLFIVPPLLRRASAPGGSRADVNVAVYRDQLRELEADLRSGTLAADQYEKARREIEARLLADVPSTGSGRAASAAPGRARAAAIALAVAVPLVAAGVYVSVGNPGALVAGAGGDSAHGLSPQQFEALVARLAAKLKENPEDAEGWIMLGRSYAVLGRFREASDAYASAVARLPKDAQLLADYADALAMAQGRRLDGEPEKLIARALAADPENVKARMLAGTIAFNKGDFATAAGHWERILDRIPPESELAQQVRGAIADARGRGAGGTAKAAPAASGRVRGVVKLAPRLASKARPGDTVFIFARAAQGPRMPLAILRKQVSDLPLEFTLDDSMAMSPAMKLSGHERVVVGARISKSGNATPQPGDLEGSTKPVAVGAERVNVVIDREVR